MYSPSSTFRQALDVRVCAYTNKLCHLVADGIERGLEDIQGKASLQSSLTIIIPQLVYFFFLYG